MTSFPPLAAWWCRCPHPFVRLCPSRSPHMRVFQALHILEDRHDRRTCSPRQTRTRRRLRITINRLAPPCRPHRIVAQAALWCGGVLVCRRSRRTGCLRAVHPAAVWRVAGERRPRKVEPSNAEWPGQRRHHRQCHDDRPRNDRCGGDARRGAATGAGAEKPLSPVSSLEWPGISAHCRRGQPERFVDGVGAH